MAWLNYKNITPEDKKAHEEAAWRRRERQLVRAERRRLIGKGFIVPSSRMRPQLLERDETGRWCPKLEIKRC